VLSNAVDTVAKAGARVVEGWPDDIDPSEVAETFAFHVGLFLAFTETQQFARWPEFVENEHRRLAARAAWQRYLSQVDVFVCPANFTTAFPHDQRPFEQRTIPTPDGERPYDSQPFWIAQASLPGLPAAVAPIGTTPAGLPVGAQIVAPLYEDDTALTFAELLADVVGGYERPPDPTGKRSSDTS
jgi:amidase